VIARPSLACLLAIVGGAAGLAWPDIVHAPAQRTVPMDRYLDLGARSIAADREQPASGYQPAPPPWAREERPAHVPEAAPGRYRDLGRHPRSPARRSP